MGNPKKKKSPPKSLDLFPVGLHPRTLLFIPSKREVKVSPLLKV